jgi:hypothetical protein
LADPRHHWAPNISLQPTAQLRLAAAELGRYVPLPVPYASHYVSPLDACFGDRKMDSPGYEAQGWSTRVDAGLFGSLLWIFGPANEGVQEWAFPVERNPDHIFLRPYHRSNRMGGDPGFVRYAFLADQRRQDVRVVLAAALRLDPASQNRDDWGAVFIFPGLRMSTVISTSRLEGPLHAVDHYSIRRTGPDLIEVYASSPRSPGGKKERVGPTRKVSPNAAGGFYLGSILVANWSDLDRGGYATMQAGPGIARNPMLRKGGIERSVEGPHLVSVLPDDLAWDSAHHLVAGLQLIPRAPDGILRVTHIEPRFEGFAGDEKPGPIKQQLSALDLGAWHLVLTTALVPGRPKEIKGADGTYEPRSGFTFKHRR